MPGIDVFIWAEGRLSPDDMRELADLGVDSHGGHVVMDGTVVDQAALMGVLERLYRAGLSIREVGTSDSTGDCTRHARLSVIGHVGDLLGTVLENAAVTEDPATTTVDVTLTSDDDVLELLTRIEGLGLDLHALQITGSQDGRNEGGHSHLG